jgi:hypothetical protein
MTQYLLSIMQPDGPPPASVDLTAVMRDVDALVQDTKNAGVWVFNGGLCPPSSATVVRAQDDELLITDGPFTEAKEHLGGALIIEAPDLDEALRWSAKLARAVASLSIEVRPFVDEAQH